MAMRRHPPRWTMRPRRHPGRKALAYHEAGHAVVGYALGLEIEQVTIVPSHGSLGRCRYQGWDEEEAAEDIETALLVLLAGAGAEEIAMQAPSRSADLSKARDLALAQGRSEAEADEQMDRVRSRVTGFLKHHWPVVKALAAVLRDQRELDGTEAIAVIRRASRKLGSSPAGMTRQLRGWPPGRPTALLPASTTGSST